MPGIPYLTTSLVFLLFFLNMSRSQAKYVAMTDNILILRQLHSPYMDRSINIYSNIIPNLCTAITPQHTHCMQIVKIVTYLFIGPWLKLFCNEQLMETLVLQHLYSLQTPCPIISTNWKLIHIHKLVQSDNDKHMIYHLCIFCRFDGCLVKLQESSYNYYVRKFLGTMGSITL